MARLPSGAGNNRRPLNFRRFLTSFAFAFEGLRYAWHAQPNFRIEAVLGVVAVGLALWLDVPILSVLILAMVVLTLELVNTALEATIDLIQPQPHRLAKVAKDVAAAAVLVASAFALVIGVWLFAPPLWRLITR